jgi:DNA sulfur modification protein DndD
VKLCLYGAAALGAGVKRLEYETYLLGRIHRPIGAPLNNAFAGVGVSFAHTVGGTALAFDVRRMWQRKRRGVEEILEVRRNGTPLADHEYAWWEQFLHDLLPPGQLVLFRWRADPDAGRRSRLQRARASIRALMGLDLLSRLRADLAIYVARQKRTGDTSLEQQLTQLADQRKQIEEDFEQAYIKLSAINREISQRRGKIDDEERLLASEGGDIAARRDALKQQAELLRR